MTTAANTPCTLLVGTSRTLGELVSAMPGEHCVRVAVDPTRRERARLEDKHVIRCLVHYLKSLGFEQVEVQCDQEEAIDAVVRQAV